MSDVQLGPRELEILWATPLPLPCRARLRQVLRYLAAHWPPPYPVRLKVHRMSHRRGALAMCTLVSGGFVIEIDSRACFFFAESLLIHEFAHAVAWDVDHSDHGAAWAGVHLDITRAFEDGDAALESESW